MKVKGTAQTVTATSPSTATTAVAATQFKGSAFSKAEQLVIDAALVGATGGTLDVYLQRKVASDTWRDLAHFPQLASGGAAVKYTATITGEGTSLVVVGGGSDAAPGVALAVNTVVNVIPGGDIRVVFVSGAGTSAGASQSITITPYSVRD